jgi:hypothetical protein
VLKKNTKIKIFRKIRKICFEDATFNNISVISWHSVLIVEEIRVPRENHRPAAIH